MNIEIYITGNMPNSIDRVYDYIKSLNHEYMITSVRQFLNDLKNAASGLISLRVVDFFSFGEYELIGIDNDSDCFDIYGWVGYGFNHYSMHRSETGYYIIVDDPIDITNLKSPNKTEYDMVHHPSHYTEGRKYEPRKVIADWGLNFNLGNAVKYLSRAGRKGDKIEDLRKAIQYIQFEIEENQEVKKDE